MFPLDFDFDFNSQNTAIIKIGSFTVAPYFPADAEPIWHKDSPAYVFLRRQFNIEQTKKVSKASVMITAAQSNGQEKLLGAYRLYVNGQVMGIGPGRGDVAVAQLNHTQFDLIDVTAAVGDATSIVMAIQAYSVKRNTFTGSHLKI